MKITFFYLFVLILALSISISSEAQLTAPGASGSDKTNYTSFPETDSIYIFCTTDENEEIATLQMRTTLAGTKTFLWEKYNENSAAFEFYFSESTDAAYSEIRDLTNGAYKVTVTQGGTTETARAWVFNNWTKTDGKVTESTCEYFKLSGSYTTAELFYYDLTDNTKLQVAKDVKVQWKQKDDIISVKLNTTVYEPPTKNTDYTLRVYDKFNCEGTKKVTYESIVTKAAFSVDFGEQQDPNQLEAPLTVTFNNKSENGTTGAYEWYFFNDLNYLKTLQPPVSFEDSIMDRAIDDSPIYTYERTGVYDVKLISRHITKSDTGFHVCTDTVYIDEYIKVDSSFIVAPNVFTPNGDGINDFFVVKFFSMQSVKISVFNRWGRKVHYWKGDNVQGFENTWEATIWDGKLMGGRYASPGVYYYVVVGEGRDGLRRHAHGFFHLFREKD